MHVTQTCVLQLSALAARNKKTEADLGMALFGKSQVQKELDKAFHKNVVLAERVNTLGRYLQQARHDIINHPALLRCQKEQDFRRAMEAECNAALRKVTSMANLNLECQAWKLRVLAANEVKGEELARREQVMSANKWLVTFSSDAQPQRCSAPVCVCDHRGHWTYC